MVLIATNLSEIPSKIMYIEKPFWLNTWFAIATIIFVALIITGLYLWFRIYLRNKTNVIIHMPDRTRRHYSYSKFTGDKFKIDTDDKDADNKPVPHSYYFMSAAVETGFFGRYIEYDYKVAIPRMIGDNKSSKFLELKDFFTFISSMLNTDLHIDLLLSQKFKDFVKVMLIILLAAIIIDILINGYNTFAIDQLSKKVDKIINVTVSRR